MKLTKKQIESLAYGLESNKRNYRLTKKNINISSYSSNIKDKVYLESRNFKLEELKSKGLI